MNFSLLFFQDCFWLKHLLQTIKYTRRKTGNSINSVADRTWLDLQAMHSTTETAKCWSISSSFPVHVCTSLGRIKYFQNRGSTWIFSFNSTSAFQLETFYKHRCTRLRGNTEIANALAKRSRFDCMWCIWSQKRQIAEVFSAPCPVQVCTLRCIKLFT